MSIDKRDSDHGREDVRKQKVTKYALVPGILTPVCLMFSYGYSIGTINAASTPLQQFYNESYLIRYGDYLDSSTLDLLWALTASLYPIGGIFGSPLVRPLVAKFGKRNTLIFIQFLCLLSTLLMSLSAAYNSFESIMIGRFLLGVYSGIGTGVGPIYVAEISANQLRGPLGATFSTAIVIGVLFGNIFGLEQALGSATGWPYLLAITGVPALVFLLYAPWLPKSPRSLYLDKAKYAEAKKVLQRLRGSDDVESELRTLEAQKRESSRVKPMSIRKLLTTKRVRFQTISVIVLMASLQLNGINGIQFYLDTLFLNAGISEDIVVYVAIGSILFQLVVVFCGGFMTEKFGRKSLLLWGNLIIIISMILYTISSGLLYLVSWFAYVSTVAALGFIFGFSVGPGPTTYSVVPELLDQTTRPAAMTVGVLFLWISFAVIGFATPYLFQYLKFAVFIPFMAITIGTLVYVYFFVPETKGKSVMAIQAFYGRLNKVPISEALENGSNNPAFEPEKEEKEENYDSTEDSL